MRILAQIIIGLTLIIASFANIIANSKPIILKQAHQLYFPILFDYNYEDFSTSQNTSSLKLDYQTLAYTYRLNPLIPYTPESIDFKLQAPSMKHFLGTNASGQDVATIILYGIQMLCFMSLISFSLSIVLAFIFGMIQGYYGGWVDIIMQRFYEVFISMPIIYILILITNLMELKTIGIMLLFAGLNWVVLVPLIRIRTMILKETEFIRVLNNFPLTTWQIMYHYISPQIFIYIKTIMPLLFIAFVLSLVALEFLGGAFNLRLGVSLGGLIWEGQEYLDYPWIIIAPCVVLSIILLALVIIFGFNDSSKRYHY